MRGTRDPGEGPRAPHPARKGDVQELLDPNTQAVISRKTGVRCRAPTWSGPTLLSEHHMPSDGIFHNHISSFLLFNIYAEHILCVGLFLFLFFQNVYRVLKFGFNSWVLCRNKLISGHEEPKVPQKRGTKATLGSD